MNPTGRGGLAPALVLSVVVMSAGLPLRARAQGPAEVVASIQVQGNVLTPDADVIRLAGVAVGDPVDAETAQAVAARLRSGRRFVSVEVRKRFASIADPSQIALVIIVDEGPVSIERTGDPAAPARLVRRRGAGLLYFPVLAFEEGHGVTYGIRVARPGVAGERTQLTMPFTWGGERRAGAQLDTRPASGPFRRVEAGVSTARRVHPFYDVPDRRDRVVLRAETVVRKAVRADASAGWERVRFGGESDSLARTGASVTLDTRTDPLLARNAVFVRAAWEHVTPRTGAFDVLEVGASGYVGLVRHWILVVRGTRRDASRALPPYEQSVLGGGATVRGFPAGSAVGDTLTAGSLELRVPLTSPLRLGKLGISVFADAATVYDEGERLRDQRFERGAGAGVWFSAALAHVSVSVARGIGHATRVHVATSLAF